MRNHFEKAFLFWKIFTKIHRRLRRNHRRNDRRQNLHLELGVDVIAAVADRIVVFMKWWNRTVSNVL